MNHILNSKPTVITESYQMDPSNKILIADCSSGNIDVILPKADQVDFVIIRAIISEGNKYNVVIKAPIRSSIVETDISLFPGEYVLLVSNRVDAFYPGGQVTQLLSETFFGNATITIPIPVEILLTSKTETEDEGTLSYQYLTMVGWEDFPEFPFLVPAGQIRIVAEHVTSVKTTTLTYRTL